MERDREAVPEKINSKGEKVALKKLAMNTFYGKKYFGNMEKSFLLDNRTNNDAM